MGIGRKSQGTARDATIGDGGEVGVDRCDPDDLLARVRRGEGLDDVVRCYGEDLVRAARRACRTEEEADDAVQDAWLAAGDLTAFRGEGSLQGWLRRIVVRACGRLRRGRKSDPRLHDPDAEPIDPTADPEDEAAHRELARSLDEALRALPEVDRALVMLSDTEGWTAPELADRFGLSPAAVRKRLSRARARLRAALE